MTFLKTTVDGKQFYDEGSNGRCSAYDPLNMRQTGSDGSTSTNAYVYTILPCAYGTIAHCGQKFLTGEHDVQGELRDKDVCTFNDWNLIKIYYVQVGAILAQFCAILAQSWRNYSDSPPPSPSRGSRGSLRCTIARSPHRRRRSPSATSCSPSACCWSS